MNIFLHEIKANMKSFLIWNGCMLALLWMMFAEFAAYYDNPEMADLLDAMPEQMLKAMSMAGSNLTTLSGFITLASVYLYLILCIYSVILGGSIIAKEERDKTAEFFMTMPVSRSKIIAMKMMAGRLLSFCFNAITTAAIYLFAMPYDRMEDFNKFMLLMMLGIFILQMVFMSIGMVLAALLKRPKKVVMISSSILLGTYILSIVSSLSDTLENLKYLSPFKYFVAQDLLMNMSYEIEYVLISLGIIVVSLVTTYYIYPRRDLRT